MLGKFALDAPLMSVNDWSHYGHTRKVHHAYSQAVSADTYGLNRNKVITTTAYIVLNLRSFIWGLDENCMIVHCITSQPDIVS